jgi:phenol 2-monooxygenase
LTILPRKVSSVYEALGHKPFGRAYFDIDDGTGYQRYGVDTNRGGVVVLRPDGWICAIISVDNSVAQLELLFKRIFLGPLEKGRE